MTTASFETVVNISVEPPMSGKARPPVADVEVTLSDLHEIPATTLEGAPLDAANPGASLRRLAREIEAGADFRLREPAEAYDDVGDRGCWTMVFELDSVPSAPSAPTEPFPRLSDPAATPKVEYRILGIRPNPALPDHEVTRRLLVHVDLVRFVGGAAADHPRPSIPRLDLRSK